MVAIVVGAAKICSAWNWTRSCSSTVREAQIILFGHLHGTVSKVSGQAVDIPSRFQPPHSKGMPQVMHPEAPEQRIVTQDASHDLGVVG